MLSYLNMLVLFFDKHLICTELYCRCLNRKSFSAGFDVTGLGSCNLGRSAT